MVNYQSVRSPKNFFYLVESAKYGQTTNTQAKASGNQDQASAINNTTPAETLGKWQRWKTMEKIEGEDPLKRRMDMSALWHHNHEARA